MPNGAVVQKGNEVEKTDEQKYNELFSNIINFAQLNKIMLRNLSSQQEKSIVFSKYSKEDIINYLKAPDKNEKQLRDMSIYLYNVSSFYRRLILYFSRMLLYSYTVTPYNFDPFVKKPNEKTLRAQYNKVISDLDKMNMRHEFQKILTTAFKQDVFYGYIYENNDSFIISELDPNYCKIAYCEDGIYNISFDNAYFDRNKSELDTAPAEFVSNYNAYKTKGREFKWSELNSDSTICIKINEEVIYPIPPFVSLFSALADIEDYRALSKAATEIDNYKVLSLLIPLNDEGIPLIDWDKAKQYYDQVVAALPPNIGAVLTPMKMDSWDFQKGGAMGDINTVANAEATFWSETGTDSHMFGGNSSSSSSLSISVKSDEEIVFGVLRQIERWVNRRLKKMSGAVKFRVNFLDVTIYNQKEFVEMLTRCGTYGLPVRTAICAAMGMSPSEMSGSAYIENIMLNLAENEVPLKSSNVQSGDSGDDGGRPPQDVVEETGEQTRARR